MSQLVWGELQASNCMTVNILLVVSTPIAVTGCSPTLGVKALLEYLINIAVPHKPGTLEWMSAIKAIVTASAS